VTKEADKKDNLTQVLELYVCIYISTLLVGTAGFSVVHNLCQRFKSISDFFQSRYLSTGSVFILNEESVIAWWQGPSED
jgi:hypothetical protein